jgi:hypothetical protein
LLTIGRCSNNYRKDVLLQGKPIPSISLLLLQGKPLTRRGSVDLAAAHVFVGKRRRRRRSRGVHVSFIYLSGGVVQASTVSP